MMIERLELKNFTVFSDLKLNFSPKINVIIGENGTGKTHLLKAAYALCAGLSLLPSPPDADRDEAARALTVALQRIFLPLDDKIGKLHRLGATGQALLAARFDAGRELAVSLSNNSKNLVVKKLPAGEKGQAGAVFVPTKEVLAFMKGFNSLYAKYELSFDQTFQDLCLLLDLPELRPDALHEKSRWAIEELEKVCGGRFVFYGGGKVTFKTGNAEYSANVMAEGFRKAGMLARLLQTGAIQPGVGGPLFWDEIEANMNPKLMRLFVEILLELSRNGQQIVLTTHDYVVLKWFDLLLDKKKGDHVRFHHLQYRDDAGVIGAESRDEYTIVGDTSISDTLAEIYDEDVRRALECDDAL